MRALLCFVAGISLATTAAYAAPDLACYAIINLPDSSYVQADSALVPRLGIANLGDQAQNNFWVKFLAVERETGDTAFVDSAIVEHIDPFPDSLEVELPEWTPEGICRWLAEGLPIVEYELLGVACLAGDESLENDTARSNVTCLWSHDVGITDLVVDPPGEGPTHEIDEGIPVTITATVENFGMSVEHDIVVRCEVRDHDSGDVLLWHSIQQISFLDWRGNEEGNPYTIDITFPTYSTPDEHWLKIEVRTELVSDMCPNDDYMDYDLKPPDVAEKTRTDIPPAFVLDVGAENLSSCFVVKFGVPHTSRVKLDVYDVSGRWIKTLENNLLEAGYYSRTWDGRDGQGNKARPGVYFVTIQAGNLDAKGKLVLMR